MGPTEQITNEPVCFRISCTAQNKLRLQYFTVLYLWLEGLSCISASGLFLWEIDRNQHENRVAFSFNVVSWPANYSCHIFRQGVVQHPERCFVCYYTKCSIIYVFILLYILLCYMFIKKRESEYTMYTKHLLEHIM